MKRRGRGLLLAAALAAGCAAPTAPAAPSESTTPRAGAPTAAPYSPLVVTATPGAAATAAEYPTPVPIPSVSDADPERFLFPPLEPYVTPEWRPPSARVPLSIVPDDHYYFAWPLASNVIYYSNPSYRYGRTFDGGRIVHTGVDLVANTGTPVLAAGPGTVTWTGYGLFRQVWGDQTDPYGQAIAIQHDFGWNGRLLFSVYAHLSRIFVREGQRVETGEQIGLVGETGVTTGPHLHFEVRVGENSYFSTRNPELWLAPPEGWGVLAGRVVTRYGNPVPEVEIEIIGDRGSYRYRYTYTYHEEVAMPDDNWGENFAIGDLPAGEYTVLATVGPVRYKTQINVLPGQTNFLVLQRGQGFTLRPTATPPGLSIFPEAESDATSPQP